MPSLSNKELEERLGAAGNSLRQPPSTSDELLPLLDQIEELLSKVEQSPSESMQNALSPLLDSLVTELLLKHVDIDVKVGLTACISEITRITAPDTPYNDEKMKEVFHLIVSSFEHLSDNSSRSYCKRVSILETVAKVRSCVIMLDLDCGQMIIDMFNHFLNSIRDFHDEAIFVSMETIMTLLLDESEDISPDLLIPILATLKNNNEEALPSAKKLAEKVIQNCSVKLKPYLTQALNVLNASPDDYSGVVASEFDTESDICKHSGENINDDPKDSRSKALENEGADLAYPTERRKVFDETLSKKSVRTKIMKLGREEPSADRVSKKASDETDVLEKKKPLSSKTKSGKVTNKNKAFVEDVLTKNDGVSTIDTEARSLDQRDKVVDDCMKMEEESLPKEGNMKKSSRKKPKVKESLGNDMVNSPKSPVKLAKDEVVESPRIKAKIKQSLSAEKASATADYNESLVDSKIRVWWPKDKMFYDGVVTSFDSVKKKHMVLYSDGDHEVLNLKKERWEFVEDDSASDGGQATENSNRYASSDMKRKKKSSTYSETSSKRSKIEDSPKSESKSSIKSKNTDSKTGGKSGSKIKTDGKSKGNSKSVGKPDDDNFAKYKDQSHKPKGKSKQESGKASGNSIDDGAKTSSNSKQDDQQIIKSKGKTPSFKSRSANGTGIVKWTVFRAKEIDQTKEEVLDAVKTDTDKGKSHNAAKSQENATKSGKKRRK